VTLFEAVEQANFERAAPLSVRMRPRTVEEFVGQTHFLGPNRLLRRMLEADRVASAIFYGPPGTGKTSLAQVIARACSASFHQLHATSSGVKDIRQISDSARGRLAEHGSRTVLFIDELHRFNRSQQDVLLPDVEDGVLILIGATTENPFFALNSPLLSRSQIFQFEPLHEEEIVELLRRALKDRERGLGAQDIRASDEALAHLARICDGDARRALNALEIGVRSSTPQKGGSPVVFDLETARESIQRKSMAFQPQGDEHYDLASALIKSMRGSDPDAAVYWLARLIESGEDIRFIARRIAICAAEDVGNADPMALVLANSATQICEFIGLPEAQLPLSQAAIYIASAPKSNASATAIWQASKDVREGRTLPVPDHLRDSHYRGAARLGHGAGYQNAHESESGYIEQDYLGAVRSYYQPTNRGHERAIAAYLNSIKDSRNSQKRDAKAEAKR
jgi:putative ATPase